MNEQVTYLHRVKAFSQSAQTGSEAGVVLLDSSLDADDSARNYQQVNYEHINYQKVATELGAATTAFCRKNGDTIDIRFFTPLSESTICIHALLASAHVLASADSHAREAAFSFKAAQDDYQVAVQADGRVSVQVPQACAGASIDDFHSIAQALGISVADIGPTPVQVIGTGKPKLLVPIVSLNRLHALDVDEEALRQLCLDYGANGVFLFCKGSFDQRANYHARHFNPLALDREDPICGIGSGALGAYLHHFDLLESGSLSIEQGVSTGNPGTVYLDVATKITVGGYAVCFDKTALRLPVDSDTMVIV